MIGSIISRPGVTYPDGDDFFSPSEAYPEYRLSHLARKPNPVYAMVRQAFAQAGLDASNYGTPRWNPLGQFIAPGSKVFILCNFVHHRRRTESADDFLGKCTHGSVVRALVDYSLLASGEAGRISFGNAPLQSCDFERVLQETGANPVAQFFADRGLPVEAKDLRLMVTERTISGRTANTIIRNQADGVTVALNESSLLHELARNHPEEFSPEFRVADYDPAFMKSWHHGKTHQYLVHKAVLESDVILCAPKLKTHEKVGITCAIKGYVGTVGRKECLPHHRFGAPEDGGDEYPEANLFLSASSRLTDWVHRRPADEPLQGVAQSADHLFRRVLRRVGYTTSGAWHGNDTAWRMSLDLARIAHYADTAGRMRDNVCRSNLAVIDGIIAGEGEGPLAPTAVPAGGIVFSDNVVLADWIASRLMGYEPLNVPSLREARSSSIWPLLSGSFGCPDIIADGKRIPLDDLAPLLGRSFRPPKGWRPKLPRH